MHNEVIKKDNVKKELIERLSNNRCSLMFFYDEAPEGNFSSIKSDEFVTVVNPPYAYEAIEEWLYLGNWVAISPPIKYFKPMNTFKTPNEEVEKMMEEHGINVLIDSFHDNIEWNIYEKT